MVAPSLATGEPLIGCENEGAGQSHDVVACDGSLVLEPERARLLVARTVRLRSAGDWLDMWYSEHTGQRYTTRAESAPLPRLTAHQRASLGVAKAILPLRHTATVADEAASGGGSQ